MVATEITEKFLEDSRLLFRKVRYVIEFVDIPQVGKHLVGISHILIDIVEIAE